MNFSDNPRPDDSRRATLRAPSRRAALAALLFACLIASNLAPARAQAPAQEQTERTTREQTAKIDEYMNAAVKADNFSGSILVARRSSFVMAKGYGMADFEGRVPNTNKTKFRIGSLTKGFTAAAVLLLQERGKLSVQDSVCKHVAPCPEAWQPVTIHHLLSHTSGIPNFTSFPDYQQTMGQPTTPAATVARFRDRPLEFRPGDKYNYSNSAYVLLGHIIEKISGQTYGAFMRENIFKPLRMENTGYDDPRADIKLRAKGYKPSPGGGAPAPAAFIDMSIPHAAGALYSTVEDLHLWEQALNTEKVLKKASLDAMFTPVRNDYGYGWGIARQAGRLHQGHGGGIEGFNSYIARYPEDGVTVIVLANIEEVRSSRQIARDLAAIVYGEKYEVPVVRVLAKVDPKIYDAYVGEYELGPGFILTITREGDRLMMQATGQGKAEAFPASETNFFFKVTRADITFVKNEAGQVTHLVLNQGGRQQPAKKVK